MRGDATALADTLPDAVRVLDAFHLVKLANQVLDKVRRVQQDTLGHRGYKGDPLSQIPRLLRQGAEHLTDSQRGRLAAALDVGDPTGEVALAWQGAQTLRSVYHAADPPEGQRRARQILDSFPSCPIPAVARLGRTLRSWQVEFLGYFDTARASKGPTRAINLQVAKIRRTPHGFRNFRTYRLRLLLYSGIAWQTSHTAQIQTRRPRLVA